MTEARDAQKILLNSSDHRHHRALVLFIAFFAAEGFNIPLFVQSLSANGAAAGFVADVLISIVVFLVWSYSDALKLNVQRWWLVLPATFLVGLSLSLPLYLFLRHDYQT